MPYVDRADVIAVYVRELGRVFILPVTDCPNYVGSLRLEPALNNQRVGVRFAEDYTLEAWLRRLEHDPPEPVADAPRPCDRLGSNGDSDPT